MCGSSVQIFIAQAPSFKDAKFSVMKIWRLTESAGPAERKMMVRRITMEFGSKAAL
jgi:hypothetical protein